MEDDGYDYSDEINYSDNEYIDENKYYEDANDYFEDDESNDEEYSKFKDALLDLPSELIDIISQKMPIEKISATCRLNKSFKYQCKTADFWSQYLFSNSIATSQEHLHKLLVELARQGDLELFQYIWKTPIVISGIQLMKENRSLWDGFVAANAHKKNRTCDYIISLDYNWINKLAAIKLDHNIQYNKHTNYIEDFRIKENIIEAVISENLHPVSNLFIRFREYLFSHDTIADMLSYSPSLKFLRKVTRVINFKLLNMIDIIGFWAAINGNDDLFDELEQEYNFDKDHTIRLQFLASSSIFGDLNATKYRVDHNITTDDYKKMLPRGFGNKDIAIKFIKLNPQYKINVIYSSYRAFNDDTIIKMLGDPCNNHFNKVNKFISSAKLYGRDYLAHYIKTLVKGCKK